MPGKSNVEEEKLIGGSQFHRLTPPDDAPGSDLLLALGDSWQNQSLSHSQGGSECSGEKLPGSLGA